MAICYFEKMVSDRQKEFNKHLHGYLKKLPKDRHKRPKKRLHRKKVEEEVVALEERELEMAEEKVAKQGFFSRLYNWVFGSEAKVVSEEDFGENVVHIKKKPEITEKKRRSYIDSIMRALWGETKAQEDYEEQELEVKKVVLVKPAVEQELKFVLKLIDSMLHKMSKRDRDRFIQSREYKVYKKIKQKNG